MPTAEAISANNGVERKQLRVMIVEDSELDAQLVQRQLKKANYQVDALRIDTDAAFCGALAAGDWDVIVADYTIPGFGAVPALERLKESGRDIPFIILSGAITDEIAAACMHAGAHDYVLKDNIARLVPAIERELQEAMTRHKKREAEDAVRYLSAIVESSDDAIVGKDMNGIVTSWNGGAERLYGYKAAEMIGRSMSVLMPPDQPDEFAEILRRLSRGEIVQMYETRRRRSDGGLVDVAITVSPIRDHAGKQIGASSIARDITKRKRAEEAVARAARHTQRVLDNLTALVGVLSLDGRLLEVNKVALNLAGVAAHEVIGQPFWETCWWSYHPDVQQRLRESITRAARGEVVRYDVAHPTRDGAMITVAFTLSPMRDDQGYITHLISSAIDITDRKRAEAALRIALAESQERQRIFDAMMENIPMGITVVDAPDVTTRAVSRFGRELIEQSAERASLPSSKPSEAWEIYHSDGVTPASTEESPLTRATVKGEFIAAEEWVVTRKDGTKIPILCTAAPIRDDQGKITGGVAGWQDLSERKRTDQALIRSEKLASVGRMAATIAHEINNPLAAACNALFLISVEEGLSASGRELLDTATSELDRIGELTKQTLAFYRDRGKPTALDVGATTSSVLDIYGPKLRNKGISVQCRFRSERRVRAIEGELRQIISNLVANSIDAVEHSGLLAIRTSLTDICGTHGASVRLTIADNGSGITPENLKRVFEPFFTTKDAIGTGLGLWVTSELVKKHEGQIRVRSQSGRGTVFSIWLPAEPATRETTGSNGG